MASKEAVLLPAVDAGRGRRADHNAGAASSPSTLVWCFRSPHYYCGKSNCGLLNQSHILRHLAEAIVEGVAGAANRADRIVGMAKVERLA